MDGASNDGSKELIESNSSKIAYWQSCPDGGPSNALRDAVEKCNGEFLVYINSDDMLLPGALESMNHYLDQYPHADVLYGHGITLFQQDRAVRKIYSDRWGTRAYAKGLVSIFQQSCALRIDAVRRAGNFDANNRTCWDGELLFRMGQKGCRFVRVNDFFGLFRIHEQSITGSQNTSDQYLQDRARMASEAGVERFIRGGYYSSLLKTLRDPVLMARKAIDRVGSSGAPVIRGTDIRVWLETRQ